ncbi:MAG: hypothetical protein ACSLE6_16145 [Mycobacterium sp.]
MIQPELVDWALLVIPDDSPGKVALFGGDEARTRFVTPESVSGPVLEGAGERQH